jgi:hypothetical protein
VLPLSSCYKILPGEVAVIQAKPQIDHLLADRLLVADPQKWRISLFQAGPRIGGSQVRGKHPALSDPGPASIARLPLVPVNDGVELEVEYVGPDASGENFVACLYTKDAAQVSDLRRLPEQPDRKDTAIRSFFAESRPTSPGEQICLPLPARAHDLHISSLTLRVTEPTHWLVSDVLIGGDTLLVDSGDLPGELLADRPGRAPLRLGRLRAKEDLVVQATYIGPLSSASLMYEVSGSEVPTNDTAADSAFLPMSSRVAICSGVQAHPKISVPQGYAFLPEEVVLRDPEKWIVCNVTIDNMAQFAASGDVPGAIFGTQTHEGQLNFSAIPGDSNLVLTANYIGPNIYGDPFICGVVGRVVRLPIA